MPAVTKYAFTDSARFCERISLCWFGPSESVCPSMINCMVFSDWSMATILSSVGLDSARRISESKSKLIP